MPAEYDQMIWFGRGPLENYADKKTGFFIGNYRESVKKDYTYYVRPQESNNKTDVWKVMLLNEMGKGLSVKAISQPLSVSAWPFSQDQIEQAHRIEALKFGKVVTLNIDHKQMGVGGDNTWNADARPHMSFRIPAKPYHYSFMIELIE